MIILKPRFGLSTGGFVLVCCGNSLVCGFFYLVKDVFFPSPWWF